mgnify:CR=1 FL=1
MTQLALLQQIHQREYKNISANGNYGTFKDNLQAPVHRWFQYPAGYSYKFVEEQIKRFHLSTGSWVIDPFVGCGTTAVVAKRMGINSVGIEAHPFVHWVAKVKTFWEYDWEQLENSTLQIIHDLTTASASSWLKVNLNEIPDLLRKCYDQENLQKLVFIREKIRECGFSPEIKDFLYLGLTKVLRIVSTAGTGWPYIAPTQHHRKTRTQDAIAAFCQTIRLMLQDVKEVGVNAKPVECQIILGDARSYIPSLADNSIDLLITSPPYLNNYDYADRTRLEMYFFGWAKSWKDITEKVRDRLMIAATTQIRREAFGRQPLSEELMHLDKSLYEELMGKIQELGAKRLHKGGKKSYDLMVAGYFNDMVKVMQQMYRVMKPQSTSVWILGDSAPYGVYIPTEEYLGRLACAVGFRTYSIEVLRRRGHKWAHNPQRHKVALKESVLYIEK